MTSQKDWGPPYPGLVLTAFPDPGLEEDVVMTSRGLAARGTRAWTNNLSEDGSGDMEGGGCMWQLVVVLVVTESKMSCLTLNMFVQNYFLIPFIICLCAIRC